MNNSKINIKCPYMKAIAAAILCTFLTALGSALPQILHLEQNLQLIVTTCFLVFSVGVGLLIIRRSQLSYTMCGFQGSEAHSVAKVVYYIPLILVEVVAIVVRGFSDQITAMQYLLLLLFVIAVGFNEEIYFRGIVLHILDTKGRKTGVVASSIIFGVLHLANAFGGKDIIYLILQMLFAFLVGFVLAEIIHITKSIWFIIAWHAIHDYVASIGREGMDVNALIVLGIQVAILLIYAIVLWRRQDINSYVDE